MGETQRQRLVPGILTINTGPALQGVMKDWAPGTLGAFFGLAEREFWHWYHTIEEEMENLATLDHQMRL
jgi:hypothetical protein